MTKWPALLLSCLALALVATGCGGDDEGEDGGGAGGQAEEQEQPADTGGGGGGGKAVSMKDIKFKPASLNVAKGTTVTWTNDDSVDHDVTKTGGAGPKFSSGTGNMAKGDTYKHTFDTAGKVEYVCTVHPNMTGSVTVK